MLLSQKYHRITESFGLEGTFKGHLVQPPCHEQGHLQLNQVPQSSVQSDLKCFQGRGLDHLAGKLVPGFNHRHCKEFLPYIQSDCTLFQCETVTPRPVTTGPAKKCVSIFLISIL